MNTLFLVTFALIIQNALSEDTSRIRKMTFTNLCTEKIWVGSWAMMPNGTQNHPLNGGWAMNAGESRIVMVSGLLTSARFWPRTGCKTQNGGPPTLSNPLRCDTGDCWNPTNNGLECAGITGQPPATLFEATLTGLGAAKDDTYDVSVVDGYNVGIAAQSVGGHPLGGEWQVGGKYNCGGTQCTFNVAQRCPVELRSLSSDGSHVAGCSSICTAVKGNLNEPHLNAIRNGFDNRTGYPLTNLVCCDCAAGPGLGCESSKCQYGCSPHDRSNPGGKCFVEHWPLASNGIGYQDLYKNECPDSYAWQFADLTSTFHCINADYNIQFCPENAGTQHTSAPVQTTTIRPAPGKSSDATSPPAGSQSKSQSNSQSQSKPQLQSVVESTVIVENTESTESTLLPIGSLIEEQVGQEESSQGSKGASLKTGVIVAIAAGGAGAVLIVVSVIAVAFVLRRRKAIQGLTETPQAI